MIVGNKVINKYLSTEDRRGDKYMSENSRGFYLPLKIIIIGLLLIIVFLGLIVYSHGFKKEQFDQEKIFDLEQGQKPLENIDYQELNRDYQAKLINILESFRGDFNRLRNEIISLKVPTGYQKLHLELIIVLDNIIHNQAEETGREELERIAQEYDWLSNALNNVITY